jgi:hypothetical protein
MEVGTKVPTKVATRVVAVMMSVPVVGMMMVGIDVIVARLLMLMLPVKFAIFMGIQHVIVGGAVMMIARTTVVVTVTMETTTIKV